MDSVTQAFLHHDQTTDAAAVILEGTDLFETDVEVQDAFYINGAFFVFLQEGRKRGSDIFMRNTDLGFGYSELARTEVILTVDISSICKDMVQFIDKSLRQRRAMDLLAVGVDLRAEIWMMN